MFRSELSTKLAQIFEFKKTSFDIPSTDSHTGSFEQETLFIEISECPSRMTDGMAYAKVTGSIVVFSQVDKMPYGYFSKKIHKADSSLTKDFFFYDIDLSPVSSPARVQNITERRVRFIYLYKAQYDPAHGSLTSVEGI